MAGRIVSRSMASYLSAFSGAVYPRHTRSTMVVPLEHVQALSADPAPTRLHFVAILRESTTESQPGGSGSKASPEAPCEVAQVVEAYGEAGVGDGRTIGKQLAGRLKTPAEEISVG